MRTSIRVVLADDHPLVRQGIHAAFSQEADIEVVGEAADGDETKRLCHDLKPDVLLLDISMPGASTMEVLDFAHTACPDMRVLILSAYDNDAYIRATLERGVVGYMLKDEATESVVAAVRTLAQGATWFSRAILDKVIQWRTSGNVGSTSQGDLNERERQILNYVAQGWDNARIAATMHLADQTIRNYISHIYSKIGVHSRAEAVVWAREHGFA